jgi:flavin-binding protein dodecin
MVAMSVAKVNEIIGASPLGFEAAAAAVIARANRTLRGITGIEVVEKRIKTDEHGVVEYRVRLRLVFDMAPEAVLHW